MTKRRLASLLVPLAILIPTGVHALGLGNISMNSALDQQLDAEIAIQSATTEDLKTLKVSIAPREIYQQFALDRPEFLGIIQFTVMQRGDGSPYIKLSSTKPIREPFLNFLVEAEWASGRVVRQFTVLVDPPLMVEAKPAAVQSPAVTTRQPASQSVMTAPDSAPAPAATRVAVPVTTSPSGAIEYGPSVRNDTLWGIAKQMRPNNDVTPQQVMMAILRDNPDAFYKGNVNNLKAGYVLRINDPASISRMSAAEAGQEVNRQYQAWKAAKSGAVMAAPAPAAGEAAKPTVTGVAAESVDQPVAEKEQAPRLKLVSPGDEMGGAGTAMEAAANEELQSALTLANEELATNRQETAELKDRLVSLEEQIQSLQRLVTLKEDQLSSMQNTAPQQPASSASLLDNPLVLAIIAVIFILLGVLGWLLFQRRKMAEYQESILSQSSAAPAAEVIATGAAVAGAAVVAGAATAGSAKEGAGESSLLTDFSSTTMEGLQSDIGEIDPISEADVYLAYGRYNQAEEIIEQALSADPSRDEYRLKLLEIYYASKDEEKFVDQAQTLRDSLGGDLSNPLWAKAVTMGNELLPGSVLFAGMAAKAAEVSASTEVLEDVASFESQTLQRDEAPGQEQVAESGLAGELGQGTAESTLDEQGSKAATELAQAQDDNIIDFDIGSLDDGAPITSGEEESALKQLQDDIAENSLEFGADFAEGKATEEGEKQPPGEEPAVDTLSSVLEDDTSLEKLAAEFDQQDVDFAATEKSKEAVDTSVEDLAAELDQRSVNFDTVEEFKKDDDTLDIESGLEEMAGMLDDAAGGPEKGRDMVDLSDVAGMEDDILGDFDEDNPFADIDEVGTKLDLARAYIDMGDSEGAQSILEEVLQEGNDEQKQQAQELQQQIA